MKKRMLAVLFCALGLGVAIGLWAGARSLAETPAPPEWRLPAILQIRATNLLANNASLDYMRWFALATEGNPGALLVREGDLLFVLENGDMNKEPFVLPWREEDSAKSHTIPGAYALSLRVDGPRLLSGDRIVSLNLDSEAAGWDWLAKASVEELAALRFVSVGEAIPDDRYGLFEKLARVNPHVGLSVPDSEVLVRVPALDPRFLILNDKEGPIAQVDVGIIAKREAIETLELLSSAPNVKLDALATMPNLRRLTLQYDAKTTVLPDLPRLEALMIECNAPDLTFLKPMVGLRELQIADEGPKSFKGIGALQRLEMLSIAGQKQPWDCEGLDAAKGLRWLSLPNNLTQEQFDRVIATHPDVQVLEMCRSDALKNLNSLASLQTLKGLVFLSKDQDGSAKLIQQLSAPGAAHELKQLRWLILPAGSFMGNPSEAMQLRAQMPDCVIAEGQPICLGSGRILLLVPLVALGWIAIAWRRSRPACRAPHQARS